MPIKTMIFGVLIR